jgi:nucleotide-binding universal stress UspA family protein
MKAKTESQERSRMVVVVGVDLNDRSEQLVDRTRALIQGVDEAEVHVVHFVHSGPLRRQTECPTPSEDIGAPRHVEYARWEVKRLCDSHALGLGTRVLVHTPVWESADELTRIAARVHADAIVVESHEQKASGPRRVFDRSVVARIARTAPCTVMTIRSPKGSLPDGRLTPRGDDEVAASRMPRGERPSPASSFQQER